MQLLLGSKPCLLPHALRVQASFAETVGGRHDWIFASNKDAETNNTPLNYPRIPANVALKGNIAKKSDHFGH